jgi:hypothetical protein
MRVGGQRHAPAALPPGKTRYLLFRRLGGPQSRYVSPPPGFDPRTVQPVASRYTDYAISAPRVLNTRNFILIFERKPVGSRRRGRPRLRWLEKVEMDLKEKKVKELRQKAVDREEWASVIDEAKALLGAVELRS